VRRLAGLAGWPKGRDLPKDTGTGVRGLSWPPLQA